KARKRISAGLIRERHRRYACLGGGCCNRNARNQRSGWIGDVPAQSGALGKCRADRDQDKKNRSCHTFLHVICPLLSETRRSKRRGRVEFKLFVLKNWRHPISQTES